MIEQLIGSIINYPPAYYAFAVNIGGWMHALGGAILGLIGLNLQKFFNITDRQVVYSFILICIIWELYELFIVGNINGLYGSYEIWQLDTIGDFVLEFTHFFIVFLGARMREVNDQKTIG